MTTPVGISPLRLLSRAVGFGAASGFLWLFQAFDGWGNLPMMAVALPAGLITGITLSLALAWPLRWLDRPAAAVLGLLTLPLGGFFYGLLGACIDHIRVHVLEWGPAYYKGDFDPLQAGYFFAIAPLIYAPWLLLPAVVTTLLLRRRMCQPATAPLATEVAR